jgi:hypothetical protein
MPERFGTHDDTDAGDDGEAGNRDDVLAFAY